MICGVSSETQNAGNAGYNKHFRHLRRFAKIIRKSVELLYKKGAALRYAAPSCNEEFENEEEFLQVSIYAGIITWTTLILLQKY